MEHSRCSGQRSFLVACTVKVKTTTPLKKVFEAAEVRSSLSLLQPLVSIEPNRPYPLQKRFGREPGDFQYKGHFLVGSSNTIQTLQFAFIETGTFKFIYDGERLQPQDTPATVR